MTTTKPCGTCPVCARSIQLKTDGTVRVHGAKTDAWPPTNCHGSGDQPKEGAVDLMAALRASLDRSRTARGDQWDANAAKETHP